MLNLPLLSSIAISVSVISPICRSQNIALDRNDNYLPNYGQGQQQGTQNYVTVPTSYGVIRGQRVDLGNNPNNLYSGQADVFLGIPYAQAPTGENRFRVPRQAQPYNNIYDATYYRPKCPQANAQNTNEDCLYLNVFSQQTGNSSLAAAVLVMIDGENGLNTGGQDASTQNGIISNLVQRGIVVVTLQYRIGALGFFTTYTDVIQPNLGMLDQVQALRWVNTEIRNFGGDPNRVTLLGQGDGGCAVSAQTLSPMSRNLFQQAIIQSGSFQSCYNPTPMVPLQNPAGQVQNLQRDPGLSYIPLDQGGTSYQQNDYNSGNSNYLQSNQPNYPQNSMIQQQPTGTDYYGTYPASTSINDVNQVMAQTLCNITAAQWQAGNFGNIQLCLQQYTVDVFAKQFGNRNATWMIVRDNNFLPDSPENLAKKRPKIPIIIGTVQDEDADYAFKLINTGGANQSPDNMLNQWLIDYAKKNKLNQTTQNQVGNIVSVNYNIPYGNNQNQNYQMQPQYNQGQPQQYNPQQQGGYNQNYNSNNPYEPVLPQYQYNGFGQDTNQPSNPNYQNQNYPPSQNQGQGNYQQNPNQQLQIGYQPQYDQSQQQTQPNFGMDTSNLQAQGISNLQSLREISQVSSDSATSLTTTEIDSFIQNGNQHVRVYTFTHVTGLGRQNVPNTGSWQPVYKGQDMYFVTMSETVWSNGNYSPQDRQMADQMGQKWANFVQTGQVTNWKPVNSKNYNYQNLNTQPTMQNNYAPQARQVFQGQVNPVVAQAQYDMQQQYLSSGNYSPAPQYQMPPPPQFSYNNQNQGSNPNGITKVRYTQNGDTSGFQMTFTYTNNSMPYGG